METFRQAGRVTATHLEYSDDIRIVLGRALDEGVLPVHADDRFHHGRGHAVDMLFGRQIRLRPDPEDGE